MPTDNFESWNLPGFANYEASRRAGKQRMVQKTFDGGSEATPTYESDSSGQPNSINGGDSSSMDYLFPKSESNYNSPNSSKNNYRDSEEDQGY